MATRTLHAPGLAPTGRAALALNTLAGVLIAAALTTPIFAVLRDVQTIPTPVLIASPLATIAPAVLAMLIAQREPTNRIAWMLLAVSAAGTLTWLGSAYADWTATQSTSVRASGERVAAVTDAAWVFHALVAGGLIVLFPVGRLPGRRWHRPTQAFAAGVVLVFVLGLLTPRQLPAPYPTVDNPFALEALRPLSTPVDVAIPPLLLTAILAAVASIRIRRSRASGLARLQIRWLALAALLIPLTLAIVFVEQLSFGEVRAGYALGILTMSAIPAAVGIAVLRYRLYEVDRLISRTLVYVPLTALLFGAWAAIIVGVGALAGDGSQLVAAAATGGAALAFRPLRARLQEAVDRRYNRPGLEALRRIERFVVEVRNDRAAPEQIENELAVALGDRQLRLRYRVASDGSYVDARGQPASAGPPPGLVATRIERRGIEIGFAVHEEVLRERAEFLDRILRAAGLAIEITRLRADVSLQVESVRESRACAADAEVAERARVRAALESGAGSHLDALEAALERTHDALEGAEAAQAATLAAATRELRGIRAELHTLIGGYAPANLDAGLASALRELARRMPITVGVTAELPPLPAEPERAAYFVCAEALTNASKHSGTAEARVVARLSDRCLRLRIEDDGIGGAHFALGGGLAGLRDRVRAVGGHLVLVSGADGTTVEAELPCAS
jgi:signal transduction histidine kinase